MFSVDSNKKEKPKTNAFVFGGLPSFLILLRSVLISILTFISVAPSSPAIVAQPVTCWFASHRALNFDDMQFTASVKPIVSSPATMPVLSKTSTALPMPYRSFSTSSPGMLFVVTKS
jgi:hypothetical protein